MATLKCKMCGGDLQIAEGMTVAECEYCGTKQTVPNVDNEKKLTLFGRANRLRMACEFDKAAGVYESIVAEFPEEAEAYWGLVLCRYGIEYVDDPATGKKIPTCHRSSFDSILEDSDFEQACENADAVARRVYREEAKAIEDIRRGIIEVSGKEAPYDIFICYKETAENGDRTIDSVIAQDVYDALTEKGYRVFFSRITLEDKLGQEYEPYIFAALNSAKIMLAFGTDYEYFNAVWVKNEWSRFLKLMAADKSKHLIPCYKGIDAYDMPKEFARLQAQDMGKVGAMQDLLRGVEKILPRKQAETVKETVVIQQTVPSGGPTAASLLKRGWMFLEDENWSSADEYFDKVLDTDPENGEAYLGKLMVELKVSQRAALGKNGGPIDSNGNYQKAFRFGSDALKSELTGYVEQIKNAQKERSKELAERRAQIAPVRDWISAGNGYTVGLKTDGTVMAAGDNDKGQCDVGDWTDIVAIRAGFRHTVGLKSDGTVVAVGENDDGQCDVIDWADIVAISVGYGYTAGLRTDGTVVATDDYGTEHWRDIVAISAEVCHVVGLKSDGTVAAVGENDDGRCDVSGWRDIAAISAGDAHTVGLKTDGTVVAVGSNEYGQCDVSGWKGIVAISAGDEHTVGLKSDGTVVAVGSNTFGQCEVSDWTGIVAISAGDEHTVGLKSDGTVVAVGDSVYDQCEVSDWKLFNSLDTLEQERVDARKCAEEERIAAQKRAEEERIAAQKRAEEERRRIAEEKARRKAELESEKDSLQTELANLKGLFTGKHRREIEARLAEIDMELEKLEVK